MRLPARRPDDADVIRARLRALLAADTSRGWVPDDDLPDDDLPGAATATMRVAAAPVRRDGEEDVGDVDPALPDGLGRHRAPGPAVRLDPGRPGARALWAAAFAAVALLVGWTWVDRPSVDPAPVEHPDHPAEPSPTGQSPASPSVGEVATTSSPVVVAVVGLVARPGLVTLPGGARVADAIEAAGGLLPEADPASVNLAALVSDGQQIAVGVPGVPGGPAPSVGGISGGSTSGGSTPGPINLNTATAAELDALPGIGPVLAQRIVDHRERLGPFRGVEQLEDVPGIGPAILGDLIDAVAV